MKQRPQTKCLFFKVTNRLGVVVNLASEISKSIKIRKSYEILPHLIPKLLLCFFHLKKKIYENIAGYKQIKAWNVMHHNYTSWLELAL